MTGVDSPAGLIALLDLTEVGPDCFLGPSGQADLPRTFGGQVLAQALIAAARTVDPDRPAHSLHAYFLRGGDARAPIEHRVTRVRDGRRFACRTVTAWQGGTAIATVMISFAAADHGPRHQRRAPVAPQPDEVPSLADASAAWGGLSETWLSFFDAIDLRLPPRRVDADPAELDPAEPTTETVGDQTQWTDLVWQRVPGPLPDDPSLHQALLVYLSDIMQLASALVPYGVALGQEEIDGVTWDGVSLDHAIWFHEAARADEWLLFEQLSPVGAAGRALTRAEVFTESGRLVASVLQEGLIFGPAVREE